MTRNSLAVLALVLAACSRGPSEPPVADIFWAVRQ